MKTMLTDTVTATIREPDSSDTSFRDTVSGDEKLPPPTAVTACTCLMRQYRSFLFTKCFLESCFFDVKQAYICANILCLNRDTYALVYRIETHPNNIFLANLPIHVQINR